MNFFLSFRNPITTMLCWLSRVRRVSSLSNFTDYTNVNKMLLAFFSENELFLPRMEFSWEYSWSVGGGIKTWLELASSNKKCDVDVYNRILTVFFKDAILNHNPNDFINISCAFYSSLNVAFILIEFGGFYSDGSRNSSETNGVLREL